jgi:lipopolysaccharide export system permease protein
MRIYRSYIGKQVIKSILMVLLILLAIESFIELAAQLKDVGKGDFSLRHVAIVVPLMLLSKVYQLFPMAALIGSIVGLGRLASRNELIALHSAGLSLWQITSAVLLSAVLLTVLVVLPGESLAPYAFDIASTIKSRALSQGNTLKTDRGTWVRDGTNFIHIHTLESGTQWYGVTRYFFDQQHELQLASFAERGEFHDGQWQFFNVQQSRFEPRRVSRETFAQQIWNLRLDPRMMGLIDIEPSQQSLPQLYNSVKFRKVIGQDAGPFEFAFWRRLMLPFATLVMILLAVPIVDGPLRSVTMGVRVVAGISVGFVFYMLNQFLGPMSLIYQVPPVLAAVMPVLVFALLGGYLLRSSRGNV